MGWLQLVASEELRSALTAFHTATTSLRLMRNVGEHAADFATDDVDQTGTAFERRCI